MYKIDFANPVSVYFAGIGGISMSGLAEILADAGFKVSGSDRAKSTLTESLEAKGIHVFYGQRAENITPDIDCVIFTSAIREDNPEYIATMKQNIPHLTRAELLGQLMRNYKTSVAVSGTHGKTTTTSMISEILLQADLDPTLSIGGIYKSIGGNIRVGGNDCFVTEACEYTNSFLSFLPTIGVILNIEEDHLDFFKDLADIRNSFREFAKLLPGDGTLIIKGDAQRWREEIRPEQILAHVTRICRSKKVFSADHKGYRFLVALWRPFRLLHPPMAYCLNFLSRIPYKLSKKPQK